MQRKMLRVTTSSSTVSAPTGIAAAISTFGKSFGPGPDRTAAAAHKRELEALTAYTKSKGW
jgi:hypothetical protein